MGTQEISTRIQFSRGQAHWRVNRQGFGRNNPKISPGKEGKY